MVDLFLSNGFDINSKMENGCTLLMAMMSLDDNELIGNTRCDCLHALLARGANLYDMVNGVNMVAVAAIQHDDVDLLQFCATHNIDLLNPVVIDDRPMGTLLHVCVATNATQCAQYLLDHGIDRNHIDVDGKLAHEMETHGIDTNAIKTRIRDYQEPPTIKDPGLDG
jgi:hypothetical protein